MKKALLIVFVVLLLISAPFWGAFVYGRLENRMMCREIRNHVLESKDRIKVTKTHQSFVYRTTGMVSAGVEYGYYFDTENQFEMNGKPYRRGIRRDSYPDDPTDWYYTERICENWFYYEVHDG